MGLKKKTHLNLFIKLIDLFFDSFFFLSFSVFFFCVCVIACRFLILVDRIKTLYRQSYRIGRFTVTQVGHKLSYTPVLCTICSRYSVILIFGINVASLCVKFKTWKWNKKRNKFEREGSRRQNRIFYGR